MCDFNTTSLGGGWVGGPDFCKTPPGTPIPYVVVGTHALAATPCFRVLMCIGPAHNKGVKKLVVFGDQPGVLGGIKSQRFGANTKHLANYSRKCKIQGKPGVRMFGIELANADNTIVNDCIPCVQFVNRLRAG